jgi:hypothetical protein
MVLRPLVPCGLDVSSAIFGVEVTVGVGVVVDAGNIKVIAGSGIRVVVAVVDCVIVGVNVCDGVLVRPVGEGVAVCVTRYNIAAWTGLAATRKSAQTIRMKIVKR